MDYTPYYFGKIPRKSKNASRSKYRSFTEAGNWCEDRQCDSPATEKPEGNLRKDEATTNPFIKESTAKSGPQTEHTPTDERTKASPKYHPKNAQKPPEKARKKPRKIPTAAYVSIVAVLCFAVTIGVCFLLTNGGLSGSISDVFNDNYLATYYALTSQIFSQKNLAEVCSLTVIQGGGSGYILEENDTFCVFYAVYKEKSHCETVLAKNENLLLKELILVKSEGNIYDEISTLDLEAICITDALISLGEAVEKSPAEGDSAIKKISRLRDEILTKKDALYKSDVPSKLREKALIRADCIFGTLDALCQIKPGSKLAGSIRNGTSAIVASMLKD